MTRRAFVPATVLVAACAAIVSCGRIISPPPPSNPPQVNHVVTVVGAPVVVAARAARTLQDYGYVTKRFGGDSTWGFRGADSIAARLRYVRAATDSSRVLIELWGRCPSDQEGCLHGHVAVLVTGMTAQEAPPQ
jgi:hypothetical protein